MQYTISSYSTAMFSTWINVEELNLLIDAGDGVAASLIQKSRKVKYVFVTHPDRDHLMGLPQFVQLNARPDFPKIYYPKDSGSFPAMANFLSDFDTHSKAAKWGGIVDQQIVPIKKGFEILAIRNEHIKVPLGVHKSLSYKLYSTKQKLKKEYLDLSPGQIKNVISEKGREVLTNTEKTNIISFSGDTPVDDYAKWDQSKLLIHECTFLKTEPNSEQEGRANKHSKVDEVLKMVSEIKVDKLILNHFSSRYSKEQIDESVMLNIKAFGVKVPVWIIYPGEVKRDILATNPING